MTEAMDVKSLQKKGCAKNFEIALLEEVIKGHLLADSNTIPKIRDSEDKAILNFKDAGADTAEGVEANFLFLLNFYATFAAEGVPPMSAYQEILTRLALTYGFFAPKTKKRQIKEWSRLNAGLMRSVCVHGLNLAVRSAKSRIKKVQILKEVIHRVLKETHGDEHQVVLQQQLANLANVENQEDLVHASSSETLSESVPVKVEADPILFAHEADAVHDAIAVADAVASFDKFKKSTETTGLEEIHPDAMETRRQAIKVREPLLPGAAALDTALEDQVNALVAKAGDPTNDKEMAKALQKVKDAAREVQEEDGQTTDGKRKKVAPKRATKKQKQPQSHEIPAPQPSEPVQGEASGSKPPEVVSEPAKVEVEVKDPKVPSPKKAPIKKRGQVSAEDLQTHWKTKEPILQANDIAIPDGFLGDKKSYTLHHPDDEKKPSIQILWLLEQIYLPNVVNHLASYTDGKGKGCTVSVRKRGGWGVSWQAAKFIAGWSSVNPFPVAAAEPAIEGQGDGNNVDDVPDVE